MAKIQNKRSKVLQEGSAKKPTAEQTEYGELCINYSTEDPALFIKDSNENIIRIAGKGANGATELPETGGEPHQPGTTDDRYVEVAGDTMTGSLTVAGNLVVGDTDTGGTNTGAYILSAGVFGATRANDGDSLWTGYKTGSSTATSYIAASGEALFKGTLTSSPSAAAYAYQINNEDTNLGGLYKDTSSSRLILGDGITSKVDIKGSDGSASFDGGITSGTTTNLGYIQTAGQGGLYGYIFATETQNGGTVALNYKADGNQTAFVVTNAAGKTAANINWSGAALFAGQIEAYGGLADGNAGVQLGQGYIAARSTRSDSGQPILDLINSDGTVVHTVAADGSSSFAGNLDVGDNKGSSSGTGLYMQANGQAYLFTGGASDALNIYQGVDRNVFINSSGSATFKGTVVSGGDPNSGAARGTSINQFGTVRAANTSGTLFEGYTVGITTPTSQIYTSGSASFAGDTSVGANSTGSGNTDEASAYLGKEGYLTLFKKQADTTSDFVVGMRYGTADRIFDINASGGATFTGIVRCNPVPGVGHYAELHPTEGISLLDGNATNANIRYDGSATFKGAINANNGINATGATFSQNVLITQGNDPQVNLSPLGYVFVQSDRADSASPILDLYNSTSAPVAQVFADGSATFAGAVQAAGEVYSSLQFKARSTGDPTSDASVFTGLNYSGTETFSVSGNGTVVTAASVYAGGQPFQAAADGVRMYEDGTLYVSRSIGNNVFVGYTTGNATATSLIAAAGSATFANSTDGAYTFISHRPAATAFCLSGGDTNDTMSPKWYITPVGAAKFSDAVTIGGYDSNSNTSSGVVIGAVGGVYSQLPAAQSNGVVFQGRLGTAPTATILGSGDATFTGTVTANGSVLTRASGDLDVGDRLEKADVALKALKVAAAASTDFASLKSAIATALANI